MFYYQHKPNGRVVALEVEMDKPFLRRLSQEEYDIYAAQSRAAYAARLVEAQEERISEAAKDAEVIGKFSEATGIDQADIHRLLKHG